MKMKRLFSFMLAALMALTLSAAVFAAGEEPFPPEPGDSEDIQLPDDMPNPDEEIPSDETLPPDDTQQPPDDEYPPEEGTPSDGEEQSPEDIMPPEEDDPSGEEPPAEEIPPIEELLEPEDEMIDVVVPATGNIILNPYGVAVSTETGESHDQIIHQPQAVTNYSDFPVIVNAAVTGSLAGDAWFVDAPPAWDGEYKELFLYLEFQNSPEDWTGFYTGAPNQLLVADYEGAESEVLWLDALSEGYFRFFGSMSAAPLDMWSDENALSITIAYTFVRDPASIMDEDEPEPEPEPFPEDSDGDLADPEEPAVPPIDPETPDDPEMPVDPENPENPEDPTDPENPEDPTVPEDPQPEPLEPEIPIESEPGARAFPEVCHDGPGAH